MSSNIKIEVEHMTRVEGHGNIVVDVQAGKIEKVQWQVPEAPRFFEAMVVGRYYRELATITSRICGILFKMTGSSVKSVAASIGSAAFLLPAGLTSPLSGIPPSIRNFSIIHSIL